MGRAALICGATGIVGKYLVDMLSSPDCPSGPWKVYALARRSHTGAKVCFKSENYTYIQANLLDKDDTYEKLSPLKDVSHIFWVTWVQGKDEEESCAKNGQMLINTLDAVVANSSALEHIVLQTGCKHYLGPFDQFGGDVKPHDTPFREDVPRLPGQNFYYTLEDIVFNHLKQHQGHLTYSIHRPTNIFGFSAGNLMNLLGTLSVYAAICKHEGLPFVFPGNKISWEQLSDASSADLIAEQEIWAATTIDAKNQAYNISNGDVFKWKKLWPLLAAELGIDAAPYHGEPLNLTQNFSGKDQAWDTIVKEKGLVPTKLKDVGNFWFADLVLNVPFENVSCMNKAKEFGFHGFRDTENSVKSIIHEMVEAKIIPSFHERYQLRHTAE
ncbi:Delta4-3-oxosteroid 5beta-reductase [Marchantia polymorpha subsp. ruderalis]|nr:hypothetical protein MARPO_0190s0002 [Marchantia polymorpha]BBN12436.1 hypothetical protein Mp_5g20060 [Marchantia polymorpha subsp. ruderalis]PTQ27604.1 hypothetical protein MARPO_0190s0002 [Marchantia polymorpha]PTQ27605.1 hypothetical protein MARPO_0190s0002 [Marchantia polymorpha]BBN12437.1 hypothetical protein Mp_5g20060 [Marchantia polymorpha subsp. ruderalis]|eukprot:PTQ27603.1 hypothetical protein MARPO_0190s0002 [Marchantia polymorpha]